MSRTSSLVAVAAALSLAVSVEAREGFGFTKKAVVMTRKKPPALNVGARRVKISVASERTQDRDDSSTLRRYTEELILAGAGTLAPEKDRGEINVKLTIDRLESHETSQQKTETRYEKIGEKQVWNDKKKKYESKDVYGNVPYQVEITTVTGDLSGAYDITDRAGKLVDSGSLSQQFNERYEGGKQTPTPARVEDDLMKRAAVAVASRLVPTTDSVSLLVPKGSFEALIPLAETNVWDRYRAGVEAVPPNRDARAEAYRQYALGVAKEGQAYASDDRDETIALLREAVKHYETAMTSNPGEKIFREAYSSILSSGKAGAPLPRATASLASFEAWASPGGTSVASKRPAVAPAKVASNALSNATLIEMSKAGLAEENLILAIDEAQEIDFDTSPNALISLSKAGVSKGVIAHMQKKATRR
jgi:hypothetical protein